MVFLVLAILSLLAQGSVCEIPGKPGKKAINGLEHSKCLFSFLLSSLSFFGVSYCPWFWLYIFGSCGVRVVIKFRNDVDLFDESVFFFLI